MGGTSLLLLLGSFLKLGRKAWKWLFACWASWILVISCKSAELMPALCLLCWRFIRPGIWSASIPTQRMQAYSSDVKSVFCSVKLLSAKCIISERCGNVSVWLDSLCLWVVSSTCVCCKSGMHSFWVHTTPKTQHVQLQHMQLSYATLCCWLSTWVVDHAERFCWEQVLFADVHWG